MQRPAVERAADQAWDDLVDRLAVYGVRYLTGGSAWDGRVSRYTTPADVPVDALVVDLARAPQARLRDALVALLFRNPHLAAEALRAATLVAPGDPTRLPIQCSVLAAAALRAHWAFVLDLYLPGQPVIDAEQLARDLGVPSPREDYGRPCLAATADLLRADQPFPFAYERGWSDAIGHILEQLRAEARRRSA